jgi:hypothetical protein
VKWKTTLVTLTLPPSSKTFGFSSDVVEAFSWGDCGYLALHVSYATGLPVATASFDTADAWTHAGVWIDDQHIVDIRGIYHYQDWLAEWEWSNNGYGYDEYSAVKWRAVGFEPHVLAEPRRFPDIDLDQVVRDVLEQINH